MEQLISLLRCESATIYSLDIRTWRLLGQARAAHRRLELGTLAEKRAGRTILSADLVEQRWHRGWELAQRSSHSTFLICQLDSKCEQSSFNKGLHPGREKASEEYCR